MAKHKLGVFGAWLFKGQKVRVYKEGEARGRKCFKCGVPVSGAFVEPVAPGETLEDEFRRPMCRPCWDTLRVAQEGRG